MTISYAALYCGYLAANIGEDTSAFQDFAYLPLWLAAGLGTLAGGATPGISARERLAWRLISAGWLVSLVGYVLDLPFRDEALFGSLSRLLFTSFYPLVLAGFLLLAAIPRAAISRLGLSLEVLILVAAAVTLAWYFVWAVPGGPSVLSRHAGTGTWPLAEIALLASAGAVLHRDREAACRQARDLLGVGTLLIVVADFALVVNFGSPATAPARQVVDAMITAGATAFACAGFCPRLSQPRSIWNVAATLPYTAITLVASILLYELMNGGPVDAGVVGLAIGAVVLTILVITRVALAEHNAADEAEGRIAQARRFRALVQEASDATLVVDAAGVVRYASESSARVLGRPADALLDRPLALVAPDPDGPLRRALADPKDDASIRWTIPHEGGLRHLETVLSDLRSIPEVAGVVLTTRDVTERVSLEQKLVLSQKLDALGLLAGGVAHDINNLLMTVQVNVELLRADGSAEAAPELREIEKATESGAALCRQLLVFGRPVAGQRRHVALGEVVRELQPMLRHALPSQISLVVELHPEADVAHIDRAQVESALINVVMNARDAIRAEGSITLVVRRHQVLPHDAERDARLPVGEYVRLSVIDDGSGMDEATAARAFEPFFTTKASAGTGLGLAAVYGTMRGLGGRAYIESTLGVGTAVHLDFPLSDLSADDARPAAESARVGHGRVLLVEDELTVRTALERSLIRSGYEVASAGDGIEALSILDRLGWEVDAIVSDLSMPRMNGATLCTMVRDRSPAMPFVLMSGYASPALPSDEKLPPDIHRLSKPFKMADLMRALSPRLPS